MGALRILVLIVPFLSTISHATNGFERCRLALQEYTGSYVLTIRGEDHVDNRDERAMLVAYADAGVLHLALEGIEYGHDGLVVDPQGGVVNFSGERGPIIGIEDASTHRMASAVGRVRELDKAYKKIDKVFELAASNPQIALMLAGQTRADFLAQAPQVLTANIQAIMGTRKASERVVWEEMRRTPFTDPAMEAVARDVDQRIATGSNTPPVWLDTEAVLKVFRAHAELCIQKGEEQGLQKGYDSYARYARAALEPNASQGVMYDFFRYVANDARNEPMAENIAKAMAIAVQNGQDMNALVGALHATAIRDILVRELGNNPNLTIQIDGKVMSWDEIPRPQ